MKLARFGLHRSSSPDALASAPGRAGPIDQIGTSVTTTIRDTPDSEQRAMAHLWIVGRAFGAQYARATLVRAMECAARTPDGGPL